MAAERLLGRFATVVTVSCVAIVALTVVAIASPTFRARLGFGRPASYPAGSRVDVSDDLYISSPLTLIMFVRSNCSACQQSKPMFGTIKTDMEKAGVPTKLVGNGLHADDEVAYAKEIGVVPLNARAIDFSSIKGLQVVPTLVLVNQRGDVIYSAEGIPTDSQRQDLLNAVASQTRTR